MIEAEESADDDHIVAVPLFLLGCAIVAFGIHHALDDEGVQLAATVVDDDVFEQADVAGAGVDLDPVPGRAHAAVSMPGDGLRDLLVPWAGKRI